MTMKPTRATNDWTWHPVSRIFGSSIDEKKALTQREYATLAYMLCSGFWGTVHAELWALYRSNSSLADEVFSLGQKNWIGNFNGSPLAHHGHAIQRQLTVKFLIFVKRRAGNGYMQPLQLRCIHSA